MRKGFTLIELLIVVAIIAILAAIAVPNFLEAQTRSKVTRAMADMRTLAVAVEAYSIDNTEYPFDLDSRGWPWYITDCVTTPIAY
ncbi:prepilin-type N-terminal cleavage/methylation domain-containing protein, partial [Candidatus Sumerlaeota bacterium]|nr:prepilin-type N-terminal cleavage/methylation domain-containing protein [Candidatus Sumerlaeota bacterium]